MQLDHVIVAARNLNEGSAWIEERLGVKPVPGGKHDLMGTHNRLLKLGERVYLEVIAIDPDAPKPSRPRWMSLDEPGMVERLAQGPALVHWVMRTDAIETELERYADREVEVLSLSRGEYRWRIGVRPDGRLPCGGRCPTLIQWEGDAHPAARLPDAGCRIVELDTSESAPRARIKCPLGVRELE